MIKRSNSQNAEQVQNRELPKPDLPRDFYEAKLKEAFGSRVDALSASGIQQAVEEHFRQHPEQSRDARQVVAVACQVKKAQITAGRETGMCQ